MTDPQVASWERNVSLVPQREAVRRSRPRTEATRNRQFELPQSPGRQPAIEEFMGRISVSPEPFSQSAGPIYRVPVEKRLSVSVGAANDTRRSVSELLGTTVRQLLAREQVMAARKVLNALPPHQLREEPLQLLSRLLAKPTVMSRRAATSDHSAALAWLVDHATEYRGRWVALVDGALVDSDESLSALIRRLGGSAATPFLHKL